MPSHFSAVLSLSLAFQVNAGPCYCCSEQILAKLYLFRAPRRNALPSQVISWQIVALHLRCISRRFQAIATQFQAVSFRVVAQRSRSLPSQYISKQSHSVCSVPSHCFTFLLVSLASPYLVSPLLFCAQHLCAYPFHFVNTRSFFVCLGCYVSCTINRTAGLIWCVQIIHRHL